MIHQLLPYAFYIILIIVIVRAFFKKINNPKKDKLVLITLILAHTQLVLGLIMLIPFLQAGIEMSN